MQNSLTAQEAPIAVCGARPGSSSSAAGQRADCPPIAGGILARRLAGLPVALDQVLTRPATQALLQTQPKAAWLAFSIRIPFLLAGLALGGCLWWVTRRLFSNAGGYIALGLFCFNPILVAASVTPDNQILAAYGLFASFYTAIGVAHALQGPRRKWRKRIVLLSVALGFTASADITAFFLALLTGVPLLVWLAESQRKYLPRILLLSITGALLLLFAVCGFAPAVFADSFHHSGLAIGLSPHAIAVLFQTPALWPLWIALGVALLACIFLHRARYFGNITPLVLTLLLAILTPDIGHAAAWLWAMPFLLTFIGGVFADVLETRVCRPFLWFSGGLIAAQAFLCITSLGLHSSGRAWWP